MKSKGNRELPPKAPQTAGARRPWLRRMLAVLRIPTRAMGYLFGAGRKSPSRRDFLQGRLWKLLPPSQFAPLVTRLPPPKEPQPGEQAALTGEQRVGKQWPNAPAAGRSTGERSTGERSTSNPASHFPPVPKPRSIGGINIDPVPPTDLGITSVPRTIPVFRPPGAVDELQFLAGCTQCGDCIAACPYHAIRKANDRLGQVSGTPIIEPDVQACLMCEDFPCITSCKPGVLTRSIAPVMGTARVTPQLCLTYHHTSCTVCSERCPVEDAIFVQDGKPIINEGICTGCGVCRYVCPAPENAILLMPAFARPRLPAS